MYVALKKFDDALNHVIQGLSVCNSRNIFPESERFQMNHLIQHITSLHYIVNDVVKKIRNTDPTIDYIDLPNS